MRKKNKYIFQDKDFHSISINSAAFFVISYIVVYILSQLSTMATATIYDFKTRLLYYKIDFFVDRSNWGFESVKTIFSIGPIVNLVIGIVFLLIYLNVKESRGKLKMFFMWGYLNAFNLFLSAIILGSFNNKGFGNVLNWSYIMDTGRMMHVFIGGAALIACGFFSTRSIIISANTYFENLNLRTKRFFAFSHVLAGAIIGIFVITLAKIPNNSYNNYCDLIGLGLIIFIILPIILRCNSFPDISFEFDEDESPNRISIDKKYVIISIVVLLLFRFGLS
ncbi:MAG: hypothetical protein K8R41_07210 [Bacteroidales bacterium]|nr:hypothetical protein [Bacteroidales bacterium]